MSSSVSGRVPQAVVIAGPNGAGKTSAAPDLLRDTVGIGAFLNADVIAEGLAAFDLRSVAMEAGRVPEEVIRRRFWRSIVNFDSTYRALSDTWRLYDGSVTGGRLLIAEGRGDRQVVVSDAGRWSEVRHQIEGHTR